MRRRTKQSNTATGRLDACQAGRARRRARGAQLYCCQPLERRLLLSSIVWSNRGTFAGANDNRFDDVFGPNASQAIAVVDAAISSWARLIVAFPYSGAVNHYDMTISMAASGTSNGASARPTATTGLGIPFQGTMTIGRGGDGPDVDVDIDGDGIPDSVGDGLGYFLDPTPYESSEFQFSTPNGFAAYAGAGSPAFNQNDLYEVVLHELGHAMGLLPSTAMKSLSTDTGQKDLLSNVATPLGNYWRFDGGEITPLMTSFDSGGGSIPAFDAAGPEHFAPAGAQFTLNGITYRGADDLMTAYYASSQRRLISENDIGMLLHAYGYTTQHAGYYGTQYDTLDSDGTLRIRTPGNGSDQVSLSSSGTILTVTLVLGSPVAGADPTTIVSIFDQSAVSLIKIDTNGGDDLITIGPIGDTPVSMYGGLEGTDTLIINGATGTNTLSSTFSDGSVHNTFVGGSHNLIDILDIENLTINGTAGSENFIVSSLPAYAYGNIRINPGNGTNNLILGAGDLANDVHAASFFYAGGSGGDAVIINNQNNTTLNWIDEVNASSVGVFAAGYALVVDYSGVEVVTINGSQRNDQFTVAPFAPNNVTLNGNAGDDSFNIGGGDLLASAGNAVLNGGLGADTLILNDSTSSTDLPWAIRSEAIYLGINAFAYTGFERVEALANSKANDFQIYGSSFDTPITLRGGNGNDQFRFLSSSTAAFDITCDGQGGADSMIVDDRNFVGGFAYAILTPTYLERSGPFTIDAVARYQNLESVTYYAHAGAVTSYVYGTSAQIPVGQQYTFFLGNNADSIILYPHDADGNLTINGTIGISGGGGLDTLTVNDVAWTLPMTYQVTNTFGAGTQSIYGVGAAGLGTSAVETLNIATGSGDDTFNVDQFKSGVGLAIYGGPGDDTLNLGNNNLPLNITNLPSFLFDGQDGFDRFNLNNRTEISQWSYSANGVNVLATRGAPVGGYSVQLNGAHNEEMTINAGPGGDTFLAASAALATHTIFNGNGGIDTFQPGLLGGALTALSLIKGKLSFDAGDATVFGSLGGGSVIVSASAHTDPISAHLTATTIGAFPGDNLFGPGGSIEFFNATSVSLTLGSGGDTLFAQPNLTAPVTLNGGNPTAAPGDTLNLALASAVGYSVNPSSATAGTVTSANLKTLTYSGFESGPNTDDVAPMVAAANININGAAAPPAAGRPAAAPAPSPSSGPSLDIQFSEDVALLLGTASIQLTNLTTGEVVPQAYVAMTYDSATQTAHFTFPGYSSGILPDGNYQGTILANSTDDLFGNALSADAPFEFFILAGDADHDRSVGFADLVAVAQNYGTTGGALFSTGDFNYDGNVDFADLVTVAQKYGSTLAPPEPLASPVTAAQIPAAPVAVSVPNPASASVLPAPHAPLMPASPTKKAALAPPAKKNKSPKPIFSTTPLTRPVSPKLAARRHR